MPGLYADSPFHHHNSTVCLVVSKEEIKTSNPDTYKFKFVLGVTYIMSGDGAAYRRVNTVSLEDRKTAKRYADWDISGKLLDDHLNAYLDKLEQARKK